MDPLYKKEVLFQDSESEMCCFIASKKIILFHENLSPPLYFKPNSDIMASLTLSRPPHILTASITHAYSLLALSQSLLALSRPLLALSRLYWLSYCLYWLSHGSLTASTGSLTASIGSLIRPLLALSRHKVTLTSQSNFKSYC